MLLHILVHAVKSCSVEKLSSVVFELWFLNTRGNQKNLNCLLTIDVQWLLITDILLLFEFYTINNIRLNCTALLREGKVKVYFHSNYPNMHSTPLKLFPTCGWNLHTVHLLVPDIVIYCVFDRPAGVTPLIRVSAPLR